MRGLEKANLDRVRHRHRHVLYSLHQLFVVVGSHLNTNSSSCGNNRRSRSVSRRSFSPIMKERIEILRVPSAGEYYARNCFRVLFLVGEYPWKWNKRRIVVLVWHKVCTLRALFEGSTWVFHSLSSTFFWWPVWKFIFKRCKKICRPLF